MASTLPTALNILTLSLRHRKAANRLHGVKEVAIHGYLAITTTRCFITYTGSDAPLKGFRGYLKKDSGAQAKILSVGVGSNVDSDNTTTLIDNLIIDNDANASYGISDGKVYNINGQVVGNGKSFNTLPSGVYIINGKKYIK